jgi:hypothetical protein
LSASSSSSLISSGVNDSMSKGKRDPGLCFIRVERRLGFPCRGQDRLKELAN